MIQSQFDLWAMVDKMNSLGFKVMLEMVKDIYFE